MADCKKQLRAFYRKRRDAMSDALVKELSFKICEQILKWDIYQKAQQLLVYYPLGKEVSLLPVIQNALTAGKQLAFPKVLGTAMAFYEVTDLATLQEGCFHVMEPVVQKEQKPFQIDAQNAVCFVPGVAFDRQGSRFGYGKGYYDNFFQKLPEKNRICLAGCAYEIQIAERLPADNWDEPMDYLISERCIQNTNL